MKVLQYLLYLQRYWRRHRFVFGSYASPRKIFNFLRAEWEAKRRSVLVRTHPWEIFIDPVNSCPLRCPLCGTGMRLHGRDQLMLSFDKFRKYLDPLAPWLYKVKIYNYGEPFLNPDLFRMITYAHAKKIAVQVNSNCNVWKEDFAEACVSSGLDLLVVSFDGMSPEAYSSYRRGGDIVKVKHAVESVAEAKKRRSSATPVIVLQFLMQAHNEHEYDAVAEYAATVGAVFFPQPITFDITDGQQRDQWLPADEAKTHYDRVRHIKKKDRPEKGCGFLWNNLVVNVDGGISPCCHVFYKSTDFGNLEENSFDNIWNNDLFRTARTMQRNRHSTGDPIVCAQCLDERAFFDAHYDLINEYRTNSIQLDNSTANRHITYRRP